MRKIERPTTVSKVGIMMHLAEYLLSQAVEILVQIKIAPDRATPAPILGRVDKAYILASKALDELTSSDSSAG